MPNTYDRSLPFTAVIPLHNAPVTTALAVTEWLNPGMALYFVYVVMGFTQSIDELAVSSVCIPEFGRRHKSAGCHFSTLQFFVVLERTALVPPPGMTAVEKFAIAFGKSCYPDGNRAFLQKPDVPTYHFGSKASLHAFQRLVPTPNEM